MSNLQDDIHIAELEAEVERLRLSATSLFDQLSAEQKERMAAEREVERLQELVLNGTLGDWEEEEKRIRALRGEGEK